MCESLVRLRIAWATAKRTGASKLIGSRNKRTIAYLKAKKKPAPGRTGSKLPCTKLENYFQRI